MKRSILAVCLIIAVVFAASCNNGGPTVPDKPKPPAYVTYAININVGAVATFSETYVWDVYFGASDTFLITLTAPDYANKTVQANVEMLTSATEGTVPVKWKLKSCSGGSSWAEGAVYQYWLQVTPVSSGITIEPATQQRVGPFTGWKIGDSKELSFKIKKT